MSAEVTQWDSKEQPLDISNHLINHFTSKAFVCASDRYQRYSLLEIASGSNDPQYGIRLLTLY